MDTQKGPVAPITAEHRKPKYAEIDRAQGRMCPLFVEDLIGPDHIARMIWTLVGRLDLSMFEADVTSFEQQAGRPAWPPQLLISVLIYGYTLGIGSARAMERMMEHEPGLRWLTGMEVINHHTLSDFRRQEEKRLTAIFAQILALLAQEDLVDFSTLLQDGTKIKAQASKQSMRRRPTLTEHLAQARKCVEELDRQAAEQDQSRPGGPRGKKEMVRERMARQRLERMQAAMAELTQREAAVPASERKQIRVSETEPEVKKMKHPDGGYAPSYNLQLVTENKNGFVVGWSVNNAVNDVQELIPALAIAQANTGHTARTVIADGGYSDRDNIEALTEQGIAFVTPRTDSDKRSAGSLKVAGIDARFGPNRFTPCGDGLSLCCPEGAKLVRIGTGKHHGQSVERYQATAQACGSCAHKPLCSPKREARYLERVVESEAIRAHERRMAEPQSQQAYRKRKQIAEYPNLRIKFNWRMERYRLRGQANVSKESFWMAAAFNLDRLHFLRRQAVQGRAA